jgi:serine/threonine protein kinase
MVPPQCSLGYAAPEVIVAFSERKDLQSSAAMDIWALGVIVYEALTRQAAVDPFGGVNFCLELAQGESKYPWEDGEQAFEFRGSRARKVVEACLHRDPERRVAASDIVGSFRMISNRTETLT